jgi:pimeloyl-ACP methyl ester carboxylesterase
MTGPESPIVPPSDLRHGQVTVDGVSLHVVEAGDPAAAPVVFVHGWPQSWHSWLPLIGLASARVRTVALDLPGIGRSTGETTDGSKRQLARVLRSLFDALGLNHPIIVGHDIGGMVAYAYAREYDDLAGVVVMDVVVPGVEPWAEVLRNPYIWHFGLHAVPGLPERLVRGRQREYFDYFYDTIAADPARITAESRAEYVEAYSTDRALTAGFNWYRAFPDDARRNVQLAGKRSATPLLYLRGEHERGDIRDYVRGLRRAGVQRLEHGIVPGSGHFAPEEAPQEAWRLIAAFIGL